MWEGGISAPVDEGPQSIKPCEIQGTMWGVVEK